MNQKMKIDFEVILTYTVADEITMVVQPINAARAMPAVIVSRRLGFMADHALGNSLWNFKVGFIKHTLSS